MIENFIYYLLCSDKEVLFHFYEIFVFPLCIFYKKKRLIWFYFYLIKHYLAVIFGRKKKVIIKLFLITAIFFFLFIDFDAGFDIK